MSITAVSFSSMIICISINFYRFFFMFRKVGAAFTRIITRRNFCKSGQTKELYEYDFDTTFSYIRRST
ncbi:hypothetical protein MtrunA17_Chr6g0481811 [Medicago truncatula]|uniref:Transmembrane protein n=1 Tax=Medicago truncatula TaxID=3880 RepID=A0A396HMI2_MEDTR|nr:hypothetical protein MtrunA17_Chr6g0481811 [Medicago truncatula]